MAIRVNPRAKWGVAVGLSSPTRPVPIQITTHRPLAAPVASADLAFSGLSPAARAAWVVQLRQLPMVPVSAAPTRQTKQRPLAAPAVLAVLGALEEMVALTGAPPAAP